MTRSMDPEFEERETTDWLPFGLGSLDGPIGLRRCLRDRTGTVPIAYALYLHLPRQHSSEDRWAFFLETDGFQLIEGGTSWLAMTLVCGDGTASFAAKAIQMGPKVATVTDEPDDVAVVIESFRSKKEVTFILSGPEGVVATFQVPGDGSFEAATQKIAPVCRFSEARNHQGDRAGAGPWGERSS